jgi:hypothetical protein
MVPIGGIGLFCTIWIGSFPWLGIFFLRMQDS